MKDTINTCKELLIDTLYYTWNRFYGFLVFVSVIASVFGLTIPSIIEWEELVGIHKSWLWIVLIICLIVITSRILWACSKKINQYKFSDKISYTPVKLVKNLSELSSDLNKFTEGQKQIGQIIDDICNKLREIFDKMTNANCCVSVKIIEGNKNGSFHMSIDEILNHKVYNFGHDSYHKSRRETEEYKNAEHFIRGNTAFSTIVVKLGKSGKNYYLNNDVNIENGYITTSPYKDENGEYANPPYKSELVFPIFRLYEQEYYSFLGFLCIDCEDSGIFKKDDVVFEISMMYANIIYELFPTYN